MEVGDLVQFKTAISLKHHSITTYTVIEKDKGGFLYLGYGNTEAGEEFGSHQRSPEQFFVKVGRLTLEEMLTHHDKRIRAAARRVCK